MNGGLGRARTKVHISLRHRQVLMPGQLLNCPTGCPAHRQPRAERMTQDMDPCRQLRSLRGIAETTPDALPRQRRAVGLAQHAGALRMSTNPLRWGLLLPACRRIPGRGVPNARMKGLRVAGLYWGCAFAQVPVQAGRRGLVSDRSRLRILTQSGVSG
jgi:hypothetical protein